MTRKCRYRRSNLCPRPIKPLSREGVGRKVLIQRAAFDLEHEAFRASGVTTKDQINECKNKLTSLHQQFIRDTQPLPGFPAKELFDWLWEKKPVRYKPHGNYRLNDVLDAQLGQGHLAVGNCLGLTLLYNCLLHRMNIRAEAIYLEHAFERGPHVLTSLQRGKAWIDVENIFRDGYDYGGHRNTLSRSRWGDKELVADIYHSLGNDCFEKGKMMEALKNYNLALDLNPRYERARLNKAIALEITKTDTWKG